MRYSIKISNIHKVGIILVPVLIIGLFFYLVLIEREAKSSYIYFFLITILVAFLSHIKYFTQPAEIQVFEKSLNFKSIFGQEKYVEIKDMLSAKVKFGNVIIINSRKEKILCIISSPKLSLLVEDIKELNPEFYTEGF